MGLKEYKEFIEKMKKKENAMGIKENNRGAGVRKLYVVEEEAQKWEAQKRRMRKYKEQRWKELEWIKSERKEA